MSLIKLARRAQVLKPSPILMLAAKAGEMKARGEDVISLSIGEPDWATYPQAKKAAIAAIESNKIRYTPSNGIPDLRAEVAKQATRDLGVEFRPERVTVSSGAKFVLFAALQVVLDVDDEIIIPAPFWASYTTMVELADAKPRIVVCGEKENFKLSGAAFRSAITPRTKMLLLNSPSNPTGKVYSRAELTELAEVLRENPQIVVLSDDIYNRLCFDGKLAPHILQVAPDLKDRVIVLNGASKSHSMTGWRLGWALGPKEIISAMSSYQSQSVSCASGVAQYAALAALRECDEDVQKTVRVLTERRDRFLEALAGAPGLKPMMPDGAFYLWIDIKGTLGKTYRGTVIHGSAEFSDQLLQQEKVAVVPGVEFGIEGYLRLSIALSTEDGLKAIERMRRFVSELK